MRLSLSCFKLPGSWYSAPQSQGTNSAGQCRCASGRGASCSPRPHPHLDRLACGAGFSLSFETSYTKWLHIYQTLTSGVPETARQARRTSPATHHQRPSLTPPRTWPGAGRCREHTVRGPSRLAAVYVRCRWALSDSRFPHPANGEKVSLGTGQACVSTAQPLHTRWPLTPRWVTRANPDAGTSVSGPVGDQGTQKTAEDRRAGGKVPTLQKCELLSA